ncbi:MAG: hypothetical protein RIR97_1299 [Pseudomonadota bacterium]|jgi:hypothetical protein
MSNNSTPKSQAIAAALILSGFGLLFFLMPNMMLWIGGFSPVMAAGFGTLCVLAFFLVFWLRARQQRRDD